MKKKVFDEETVMCLIFALVIAICIVASLVGESNLLDLF